MDFKVLPMETLRERISKLRELYKQKSHQNVFSYFKKENSQRDIFFSLLDKILEKTKSESDYKKVTQLLYGALVFELEFIKEIEYNGKSPDQRQNWFSNVTGKGSSLYTQIKEILDIDQHNRLDNDLRLIYLNKFYWYIKDKFPYQQAIHQTCIKLLIGLKHKEEKRIGIVVEGTKILSVIQKKVNELIRLYKDEVKTRQETNKSREESISNIELINMTCDSFYHMQTDKNQNNRAHDLAYIQSCNVRVGIILFTLLKINYSYKLFSPHGNPWLGREGSVLFKDCLKALEINNINKIDRDKRIEWLQALSVHVKGILKNQKYYNALLIKYPQAEQLITLNDELDKLINDQQLKKAQPTWTGAFVNNIIQYGLGFAATHLATDVVLTTISGTVAGILSGPVVLAVYLTGGTLLMTQFGKLINDKMVPKASAFLYSLVLSRLGGQITQATTEMATYAFEVTRKGWQDIMNIPQLKKEDIEFLNDLKNTLLELPSEVFSPEEKEEIRNILPIEVAPKLNRH